MKKKINVGSDSNLGAQGWRLASSPSDVEHKIYILTRTVLVIYFKCQNTQVKTSVSRSMALSAKIRDAEVVPQHFHVDCHIESARKARRHDLWRRDVLPQRRSHGASP